MIAVGVLAERHGGVRALARAMEGQDGRDWEPAVRRWLSLSPSEPRSIIELNRILGRISKFSRTEIRKMHRRIRRDSGRAGDRQAVFAHVSLLDGADKPIVLAPEETLVLPLVLVVTALFVGLVCRFAECVGTGEVFAPSVPSSMP